MMKAIFDRVDRPKKFPVDRLVNELCRVFGFQPKDTFRVTRIGGLGVGGVVQKYEAVLDQGGQAVVSLEELCAFLEVEGEVTDWLYCVHHEVAFGIRDSCYMFVQAENRQFEDEVARSFARVTEAPDCDVG